MTRSAILTIVQLNSKDHRTLAPSCTISTINHVVISGKLHTAGPSWSLAKPANQSLAHVASVQTLKASCAVRYVLSVSEMDCHSAGADEVSQLPSNVI